MVTDPPYGVDYDPKWRAKAGVNRNKRKLGTVAERRPGRLARGLGAVSRQRRLCLVRRDAQRRRAAPRSKRPASRVTLADHLGEGSLRPRPRPLSLAARAMLVRGPRRQLIGAATATQTTLWNITAREDSGHGHGTQKPVECMRRPIENNCSPGQAVYEPFSGSGTTIIAAEMTGRAATPSSSRPHTSMRSPISATWCRRRRPASPSPRRTPPRRSCSPRPGPWRPAR